MVVRSTRGTAAGQKAPALAGVVLGALGSGVLRAVVAQLGRSVFDPWSIAAACVVLAVAGAMACLVPAVRAGRAAPMHALRGE